MLFRSDCVRLDVDALIDFPILSKLYLDTMLRFGFTFDGILASFAFSLSFSDTLAFLFLALRCTMRRERVDTSFDCKMYPVSRRICLISLLVRLAVHLLKSEIRATPSICAVGRDPRAQETKNIT